MSDESQVIKPKHNPNFVSGKSTLTHVCYEFDNEKYDEAAINAWLTAKQLKLKFSHQKKNPVVEGYTHVKQSHVKNKEDIMKVKIDDGIFAQAVITKTKYKQTRGKKNEQPAEQTQ